MGLNFNGTEIENVNFNGVEVNKVVFNGTTVWEKQTQTSASLFTFEGNACTGYVGDNNEPEIIIPRSYSIDAEGNFVDGEDYNVTSVTINSAERGGFDEYTGNIILQDNISSIGKQAFMFSKLKSVIIGENVTTIGESAFASCENLETITIPTSVTSIETFAFGFGFSSKLKEINVSDDNVNFRTSEDKRCLVDSNGAIIAFASSGIDIYVIPNSVFAIGDWAFTNMKLTAIKIPDSVTSIGEYAFYNCSNLQSLTIPRGVTSIGFSSLTNLTLTQITIEAITPPTLASTGSISSSITTIYIPTGTLEAYQTADVWADLDVQYVERETWHTVFQGSITSLQNQETTPKTYYMNFPGLKVGVPTLLTGELRKYPNQLVSQLNQKQVPMTLYYQDKVQKIEIADENYLQLTLQRPTPTFLYGAPYFVITKIEQHY